MAKRLQSLGALTQGDRSATVGAQTMRLADFDVDTKYGMSSLQRLLANIRDASVAAVTIQTQQQAASQQASSLYLPPFDPEEYPEIVENILTFLNSNNCDIRPYLGASETRPVLKEHVSFAVMGAACLRKVGIDIFHSELNVSVPKFLNRILGLDSTCQNLLFEVSALYSVRGISLFIGLI